MGRASHMIHFLFNRTTYSVGWPPWRHWEYWFGIDPKIRFAIGFGWDRRR
jgi:hypothetical protein